MISLIFIIVKAIICLNLGKFELIEKCPLLWKPYTVVGTKNRFYNSKTCHNKCDGKAFHTDEGKLICSNKMVIAQRIPNLKSRWNTSIIEKCNCGYNFSWEKRYRMSCNVSIPDTTEKLCDGICEGLVVYIFKRHNQKRIIYCEQNTRKEFYEMSGHIEEDVIITSAGRSRIKRRICECGIANTKLMDVFIRPEKSLDSDIFEECADPWKASKFADLKSVDRCTTRCHRRCQPGYGVYYKDKPFCFHQTTSLVRRSIFQGGSEGICECGHCKQIMKKDIVGAHKEFISCKPPIVRNDLKPRACKKYCSELLAYMQRSSSGPWNITCMSEDDHKSLKPEPLSGKCDIDVHRVKENDKEYYMICRCGLHKKRKKHKSEISHNRTHVEIELPAAWSFKKKRSERKYQKSVKFDNPT